MAQAAHTPDKSSRRMVQVMIAGGILQEQISGALGISGKTLRRHYRQEIRHGAAQLNGLVVGALYHAAINGKNVTAMIWLTKRMGWSETNNLALTGADGGPLKVEYSWAEPRPPE